MHSFPQIDQICHTSATHGVARERGSAALIYNVGSLRDCVWRLDSWRTTPRVVVDIPRLGTSPSAACYRYRL